MSYYAKDEGENKRTPKAYRGTQDPVPDMDLRLSMLLSTIFEHSDC